MFRIIVGVILLLICLFDFYDLLTVWNQSFESPPIPTVAIICMGAGAAMLGSGIRSVRRKKRAKAAILAAAATGKPWDAASIAADARLPVSLVSNVMRKLFVEGKISAMSSGDSPDSSMPLTRDDALYVFLRNTHQARRTLTIPGVMFPGDHVMPLKDFIAKYEGGPEAPALVCFWKQFSPILPGEFLINFHYVGGAFGLGGQMVFFLTNLRLILWDSKHKRHHILDPAALSEVIQPDRKHLIVQCTDGQSIEITDASPSVRQHLALINAVCKWAQTAANQPAPSAEAQSHPAPQYVPQAAAGSLRWYYCVRVGTWLTSVPVILWLICMIYKGTDVLLIPGFLGFLLIAFVGFGSGYVYGFFKELGLKTRNQDGPPDA